MKLDFVKLSPTHNMTILVASPLPRSRHASVAEQLMSPGSVQAEQVGFIENASVPGARLRLQMMGGEFCGNAAMSVGALLAFQENLPDGASAVYPLEISGAEGIVKCRITRQQDGYRGTVAMPVPESIREIRFSGGVSCPVVFMPGIAHAIVPGDQMTPAEAQSRIQSWCEETHQEAFGILLRSGNAIRPLVYVRETASAVWEQGCGSGSAALAAYESHRSRQSLSMDISQPGGVIRADACFQNGIAKIEITGTVKIVAMGQAWID